jgi:hypothetical protein
MIALYIANIKSEVANRPTYVIRKVAGEESEEKKDI